MNRQCQTQHGFSMIELIIVIAIIGILSAIAIPSYTAYMQKTRRIDATTFLQETAGEQYRFFTENNRYATEMQELGYGAAATFPSKEGLYTVSIANPTPTSYVLTAAPVTGGAQAGDAECGSITLSSTGLKGATGTGGMLSCW